MDNHILKFLLTIMFVISGFRKFKNPDFDMKRLAKHVELSDNLLYYMIVLAGMWEIVSVYAVFQKNKQVQLKGVYSLVVFTILVTLLVHFPPVGFSYYPFISNVSTVGGLLALAKLIKNNN